MKYSKINIDRAPLTEMDIESGQDFSKVLKGLDKVNLPWYKSTAFVSSGVVVGIGALLVGGWFAYQAFFPIEGDITHPVAEETHLEAAPPLIQPISQEMDMAYSSYMVGNSCDTTIVFNLSQIHIPENCFVNAAGELVEKEVELLYREFHDKYDIIFSGIPMGYDSAGTSYQFESAGMFEIRGMCDGEEVFIAPDKHIEVEMHSLNPEPGFNEYVLNEETGQWEYLGVSTAEIRNEIIAIDEEQGKERILIREDGSMDWETESIAVDAVPDTTQYVIQSEIELAAMDAVEPLEPKKADPKRYQLNFDYDSSEFPELAAYDDMLFEVAETNKNFQADKANVEWNDIKIRRGSEESSYVLTFVRPGERFSVLCYPVIESGNLSEAMKQYEQAMKEYNELQEQAKQAREAREQQERERRVQMRTDASIEMDPATTTYASVATGTQRVYRVLNAARFGFYNCDSPRIYPNDRMVLASYQDENGGGLWIYTAHLAEKKRNVAFNMPANRITYDIDKPYLLLAVSEDGEVYRCTSQQFDQDCDGNKCTFTMKRVEDLDSPSDLNDLMASVE